MKSIKITVLFFTSLFLTYCSSTPENTKPMVKKTLEIKASKDQVWSALTDEKELAQWWHEGMKLEPKEGGEFYEPWGKGQVAKGKVMAFEPQKSIRFSWQENTWKPGQISVCEFILNEDNGLTTLIVNHSGWGSFSDPEQMAEGFNKGWDFILPKLKTYLEKP